MSPGNVDLYIMRPRDASLQFVMLCIFKEYDDDFDVDVDILQVIVGIRRQLVIESNVNHYTEWW